MLKGLLLIFQSISIISDTNISPFTITCLINEGKIKFESLNVLSRVYVMLCNDELETA